MIDTGLLTVDVVAALRNASGELVGDAVKPQDSGWLNGEPNSGVFVPYSVVVLSSAQSRDTTLPYRSMVRSWMVSFRLTHYGASRAQADFAAFKVRSAVDSLILSTSGDFKVTGARWPSLGAMTRDDSVNPALWSVSDSLILMADS